MIRLIRVWDIEKKDKNLACKIRMYQKRRKITRYILDGYVAYSPEEYIAYTQRNKK